MEKFLLLRMTKYDRRWEPVAWADFITELDREVAKRREYKDDAEYRFVVVRVNLETMSELEKTGVDPLDTDPATFFEGGSAGNCDAKENAEISS